MNELNRLTAYEVYVILASPTNLCYVFCFLSVTVRFLNVQKSLSVHIKFRNLPIKTINLTAAWQCTFIYVSTYNKCVKISGQNFSHLLRKSLKTVGVTFLPPTVYDYTVDILCSLCL